MAVDQVAAGRPGPQALGHPALGHRAGPALTAELLGRPVGLGPPAAQLLRWGPPPGGTAVGQLLAQAAPGSCGQSSGSLAQAGPRSDSS
jgi:hypothetical protein